MKLTIGTKVIPTADCPKEAAKLRKSLQVGWIRSIIPAIGTAGEESYYVYWLGLRSGGSGWRDCDIQKA